MGNLSIALIGGISLLTVGFVGGWETRGWKAGAEAQEAQRATLSAVLKAKEAGEALGLAEGAITLTAGQNFAKQQERIVTRTITQIKEVPIYVPREANAACIVPLGFVKLLNASAASVDLASPSLALPAGQSNGTSTAVDLAAVASSVAENYGRCNANAKQLDELNAWVKSQQELHAR